MLAWVIMAMLWLNDPGQHYNQVSGAAPAYLDAGQQLRWQRLRACRMLFEGHHRRFYFEDARSQFPFRPLLAQGRLVYLYVTVNMLKLVSTKTADLMLAAKPKIDAPTAQQTQALDDLARISLIHPRLRQAAVQASWAGGAFLESLLWRGQAYLQTVNPDDIYPVGVLNPNGQYESYVRFATQNIGTIEKPKILLLKTTYAAGAITRELHQIDDRTGQPMAGNVDLALWPQFAPGGGNITPQPNQATGLDRPTITYVPNFVDEKLEVSDYDGLISLQDSINAKRSQMARALVLHADPKMWFDTQAVQPDGTVRADDSAFFGAVKPEYITWESQQDAAQKDYESTVLAFCAAAEMSPVGLGLTNGGQAAESAAKRRLDLTPDLAKAAQKALYFEPAIALALETTQMLDQATPLLRSYPLDPIGVHMQDGLPVDDLNQANVIATLGVDVAISLEDAVALRIPDPAAAAIEVARIRTNASAKMPTVFGAMGGAEPTPAAPHPHGENQGFGGGSGGAGGAGGDGGGGAGDGGETA